MNYRVQRSFVINAHSVQQLYSLFNYIVVLSSLLFCCIQFMNATEPATNKPFGVTSMQPMHISAGWNLMSLPVIGIDSNKNDIYPTSSSLAYIYQHGYESKDTLIPGEGYWLKFNSDTTIELTGVPLLYDTIPVSQGWNIVGSISIPIAVNSLLTEPPGIISSQFFGYVPGGGYQQADTLQPGSGYWVKVSQNGSIILGSSEPNIPCAGIPTLWYGNEIYSTVQIGNHCWLKGNLDIGTMIPGNDTASNNGTIEKYCYNNNPTNCDLYGGLYQWNEAMQYSTSEGAQGICPTGWHIPTNSELQDLVTSVNDDGNALKAVGQGTGGGAGTDVSGFSALLTGFRDVTGTFYNFGDNPYFWSSTENSPTAAPSLSVDNFTNRIFTYNLWMTYGLSVRCIMN